MSLRFQPVLLGSVPDGDDGMLVFQSDRLIAIVSHLGDLHGELAGRWFVEATFAEVAPMVHETFATLSDFEGWAVEELDDSQNRA